MGVLIAILVIGLPPVVVGGAVYYYRGTQEGELPSERMWVATMYAWGTSALVLVGIRVAHLLWCLTR